MGEQAYPDVFDQATILTDAVKAVILSKHPEVSDFFQLIPMVLRTPDEVRQSMSDPRTVLYYRYEASVLYGKWIVVVVKRTERNFVSTIYATDKIKSGDVLWKK